MSGSRIRGIRQPSQPDIVEMTLNVMHVMIVSTSGIFLQVSVSFRIGDTSLETYYGLQHMKKVILWNEATNMD